MDENGSHHAAQPVRVRAADSSEAEMIAAVIRAAFATVAEAIGVDIPPLHETADDVRATLAAGDTALVAVVDGIVVGTVRGETIPSGGVMVRRLAVLPSHRGHGVAHALMRALEDAYPDAQRFELFTGAMAEGPIALYESLGYKLIEPREDMGFPLVWYEKCREDAS